VADGNVLHQWVVRLTIGQAKASGRPGVERKQLTSSRSPADVVELVCATLDEKLDICTQLRIHTYS
jgi:hypothetical protein